MYLFSSFWYYGWISSRSKICRSFCLIKYLVSIIDFIALHEFLVINKRANDLFFRPVMQIVLFMVENFKCKFVLFCHLKYTFYSTICPRSFDTFYMKTSWANVLPLAEHFKSTHKNKERRKKNIESEYIFYSFLYQRWEELEKTKWDVKVDFFFGEEYGKPIAHT